MEQHRRRRKLMSEINMIPLIDVMLVLLVVFMITAPLITQGIKVDLPQADSELVDVDDSQESLVVSINAAGEYFVNLGDVAPENPAPVALESIGDSVGKIMQANPGVPVFVEGDENVAYGKVINLVSILEAAGVPNVRLITEPMEN